MKSVYTTATVHQIRNGMTQLTKKSGLRVNKIYTAASSFLRHLQSSKIVSYR